MSCFTSQIDVIKTMAAVKDWTKPQRITLGVNGDACRAIMDEWLYRQAPVTMTVRRARTEGMVCIIMDVEPAKDAKAVYFAAWCINIRRDIKVDIKPL